MTNQEKTIVDMISQNYIEIKLAFVPSGCGEDNREYMFFLIDRIFGKATLVSGGYGEDGYKHFIVDLGDYNKRNPKSKTQEVVLLIFEFLEGQEKKNIAEDEEYKKDKGENS